MLASSRLYLAFLIGLAFVPLQAVALPAMTAAAATNESFESGPWVAKAKGAVELGLPVVEAQARDWMDGKIDIQKGRKCVSCHYVSFGAWTQGLAGEIGFAESKSKGASLLADAITFLDGPDVGAAVTYSTAILAASHLDVSDENQGRIDGWIAELIEMQTASGRWEAKGQFPEQNRDEVESDGVATAWVLLALDGIENKDAEAAYQKGLNWYLASDRGDSTEWWIWAAAVYAKAKNEKRLDDAIRWLQRSQNEDGGWSWIPGEESDAYTTGQALYVLSTFEDQRDEEYLQRAVAYLTNQQRDDGAWFTESDLVSAEPTASKDKVYNFWGTSWAVAGLSQYVQAASLKNSTSANSTND